MRLAQLFGCSRQRCFVSKAEGILGALLDREAEGFARNAGTDTPQGLDLGVMRQLLGSLEEPQDRLASVVSIAGTKGKGSVATMLASILTVAGHSVGLYTSPHVTNLRERICVDGQWITEADFNALAEAHRPTLTALQGRGLSHFEALTALALKYFQQRQVDYAVVEAGLGGARDATNVFRNDRVQLSIITAIGFDHQHVLGNTLAEIATAKAGIMKPSVPVVLAKQAHPEADEVLRRCAAERGSFVISAPETVNVRPGEYVLAADGLLQQFDIQLHHPPPDFPSTSGVQMQLTGEHQADNAAAAVSAALSLRTGGQHSITMAAIADGLARAVLPGRFQVIQSGAATIVLDGAHTVDAAASLVRQLDSAFPGRPVAFVLAMAADKDAAGIVGELRRARPRLVAFTSTPIAGSASRMMAPGVLAAAWQAAAMAEPSPQRCRQIMQANVPTAIESAVREMAATDPPGVVCVCGSLHAVAAALQSSFCTSSP